MLDTLPLSLISLNEGSNELERGAAKELCRLTIPAETEAKKARAKRNFIFVAPIFPRFQRGTMVDWLKNCPGVKHEEMMIEMIACAS